MLRKNSTFGSRRLKGLIFIVAQILGGVIAAMLSLFLVESGDHDLVVKPMFEEGDTSSRKSFAAMISEASGSFVLIFLFMICTDKKTQFSQDKVINCFVIASSYVSARLMAGGRLVTAIQRIEVVSGTVSQQDLYKLVGPLLNPALALGQCLTSLDFSYAVQYIVMPFVGSALALIFYEQVFIRSQEYMADDDEDEDEETLRLESDSDIKEISQKSLLKEKDTQDEPSEEL